MGDDRARQGTLLLVIMSMACLFIASAVAQATDTGLDVCPANAKVKALPFLKAAKPGALGTLLPASGGFSIDRGRLTDLAKTTLVPILGANIVFFVLSLLFLLIFILWRLLRWCCYVLCCRGSCDAKRQKKDPYVLLFGKGTKVIKGAMLLFGLVAIAFAVYGLATVDKNVTDEFFGVVATIVSFVDRVATKLDALLGTVGSVNGIIDDFQAIVTNRINVTGFNFHLTAVGGFLDGVPQPATMSTAITALNTLVKTTLVGALSTLATALATGFAAEGAVMTAGFANIAAGANDINNMKTLLLDVDTKLTAIDWSIASAPGAATPGATALNNLKTAVDNAYTSATTPATAWRTVLSGLSNALDNSVGTSNPYANLLAKIAAVETTQAQVQADVPTLVASITSMDSQYTTTGSVSIAWLLRQLQAVDADVLVLTGGMKAANDQLANTSSQLVAFFNNTPTPMGLAADLTAFSNGLPATTSLATLKTQLTTAQTTLFTDFPPADTLAYKTWLAGITTAMTNLITATAATGPLGALKAAVSASAAAPADNALWTTLRNTAKPAYLTVAATLLDPTHLAAPELANPWVASGNPPGVVQHYATTAGAAPWNVFTFSAATFTGIAAASTYVTATQTQITTHMPDVTSTVTNIDGVAVSFAALGTPPSQVTVAPRAQLADISSAITNGNTVKAQITSVITGFRSSTANLKSQVVGRAEDLQTTYQAPAQKIDSYRYTAAMVLFGISMLFVLCVLASAACNYHFGANLSTLWLLLVTLLYLLLALLVAVVVSVLFLGCSELEPLAVRLAPASFTPLLRYYFYNKGMSVAAVLKSANLVDVDAVLADMTRSQTDVTASLTGKFTFRPGPLAVIGRLNTTVANATAGVDSLLNMASREELMPVYSEVKGFVCCTVPDIFGSMWTGLTFAGIFALALIVCTFFYIGRIDQAPRKDCCGCTCHTHSKYIGTVTPADTLPEYNKPGLENPLGPYDAYAAPNSAGFAVDLPGGGGQWGDEGAHVVVNRPVGDSGYKF